MAGEFRTVQQAMARLSAQGYEVVWERGNEVQMRRRKRFSFWWFLFWTVFSLGTLFWLYPLWHWAKRDELVFLRMEEGRLTVTSNRWQLLRPLAYSVPLVLVAVLIAVIAAGIVTGGGDRDEGDAVAPTPKPKPNEAMLAVGAVAELKDSVRVRIDGIVDPCVLAPFQELEPGTRMVAYQLTFENLAKEQQTIGGFGEEFTAKDAADFQYDDTFPDCEGEPSLAPCLFEDLVTTTQCRVGFEVREGQQIVELRYDPNPFTTTDIVFRAP